MLIKIILSQTQNRNIHNKMTSIELTEKEKTNSSFPQKGNVFDVIKIEKNIKGKPNSNCNSKFSRQIWNFEDDILLIKLNSSRFCKKWKIISEILGSKSARQCLDRINFFKTIHNLPDINYDGNIMHEERVYNYFQTKNNQRELKDQLQSKKYQESVKMLKRRNRKDNTAQQMLGGKRCNVENNLSEPIFNCHSKISKNIGYNNLNLIVNGDKTNQEGDNFTKCEIPLLVNNSIFPPWSSLRLDDYGILSYLNSSSLPYSDYLIEYYLIFQDNLEKEKDLIALLTKVFLFQQLSSNIENKILSIEIQGRIIRDLIFIYGTMQ